uniref:Uncharacterized protein n=1 Tax=Arundo donax TaxID=35708 RepID=A0A0A8ZS33_ARUDO
MRFLRSTKATANPEGMLPLAITLAMAFQNNVINVASTSDGIS